MNSKNEEIQQIDSSQRGLERSESEHEHDPRALRQRALESEGNQHANRALRAQATGTANCKSTFTFTSSKPLRAPRFVFAAPQLSIFEMQRVANLCCAKTFKVPVLVCTSPQVYSDADRMGIIHQIENSGAKVLQGTCFYNQYAREIGVAKNWV